MFLLSLPKNLEPFSLLVPVKLTASSIVKAKNDDHTRVSERSQNDLQSATTRPPREPLFFQESIVYTLSKMLNRRHRRMPELVRSKGEEPVV